MVDVDKQGVVVSDSIAGLVVLLVPALHVWCA